MKQIICYIRTSKYNETKQELLKAGIYGLNSQAVQGRGKKSVPCVIEDHGQEQAVYQNYPLMPKKEISIVVEDTKADEAIAAIIRANQTGSSGDGKIFVLPVDDVVTIRTSQHTL